MDSLVEKLVVKRCSSSFVNELEKNSEYKVTSTRKKLVERHHDWKAEAYKGMPANSNSNQTDENGNHHPSQICIESNHTHYSPHR